MSQDIGGIVGGSPDGLLDCVNREGVEMAT